MKFPVKVGEAAIVNQVFDLYAKQRLGVVSVARWLNENGYRNRNGNLWRPNAVHGILTNRVWTGQVRSRSPRSSLQSTALQNPEACVEVDVEEASSPWGTPVAGSP